MTTKFFTGGALAALAAALTFTAVPASAQDRHHNDRDNNGSAQTSHGDRNSNAGHDRHAAPAWGSRNAGDQPQRTNTPAAAQSRGQWSGQHDDQRAQAQPNTATSRGWAGWSGNRTATSQRNGTYTDPNRNTTYADRGRSTTYRSENRGSWNDRRDSGQSYRGAGSHYQQWDRSWRNNNRYDWQRYRTVNRNVYHVSPYYAPYRGYSYRRLGVGFYLDPLFFGPNYLIGDPGYYRLPDVYGPYRWVRYYDDALLVNVYTGEVADVIYDFFW